MSFESELAPQGFPRSRRVPRQRIEPPGRGFFFDGTHNAPDRLGSGIDKDRPDYSVYCGGCRIYQTRGGPDNLRWFWTLTVNGPMTRAHRVATLEEANAQFQQSWDAWKAWAKLEEAPYPRLAPLLRFRPGADFL